MGDTLRDGRDEIPEADDEGANLDPKSGDMHDDITIPPTAARTSVDSPGLHDDATLSPKSAMALSLEQFVSILTQSGVMSDDDFTSFLETLPDKPKTTEDLAKELVQAKKLTKYQTQLIYQGTGLTLGNYLILDKIGEGGMGQVYLAEHRRMGRRVALKTLPKSLSTDTQAIQRFQREVKAAAKLSHPNIVTAYDADEVKRSFGPILSAKLVESRTHRNTTLLAASLPARESHTFLRNRARPDDSDRNGLQPARFNQRFAVMALPLALPNSAISPRPCRRFRRRASLDA